MPFAKQLNITWTNFNDSDNLWSAINESNKILIVNKINEMVSAGKTDGILTLIPTDTPGQLQARNFLDDAACMEWLNFLTSFGYIHYTYQIIDI